MILAEDGNIKSSMCLLKGPRGPIPNRSEKFGKLEENLKWGDRAKTALQHLAIQSSQNNNQRVEPCVHMCGFNLYYFCVHFKGPHIASLSHPKLGSNVKQESRWSKRGLKCIMVFSFVSSLRSWFRFAPWMWDHLNIWDQFCALHPVWACNRS